MQSGMKADSPSVNSVNIWDVIKEAITDNPDRVLRVESRVQSFIEIHRHEKAMFTDTKE